MTIEKRNEWLVNHLEHIEKTVKRFCDRYEECTYDEMYSDVIMWLIEKLDEDTADRFTDISKSNFTTMVLARLNTLRKRVPLKEDPVDPSTFEIVYTPDFYRNIIPWECEKYVKMSTKEMGIFFDYTFGDCITLEDLSKKYGHTEARIGQIYKKACEKVLFQLFLSHHSQALYFKFDGKVMICNSYNRIIPVHVSAIIKSPSKRVGSLNSDHGYWKLAEIIAEKFDVEPWHVDTRFVRLKSTFTSDNLNLEEVELYPKGAYND